MMVKQNSQDTGGRNVREEEEPREREGRGRERREERGEIKK
jgi:hypothetical protein